MNEGWKKLKPCSPLKNDLQDCILELREKDDLAQIFQVNG